MPREFSAPMRFMAYMVPVLATTLICEILLWNCLPMGYLARTTCTMFLGINILMLASSAWSSFLGVLVSRSPTQASGMHPPLATKHSRTAVVMPVHMEDPYRVFAATKAMQQDLAGHDVGHVEFWVLSDSKNGPVARLEQQVWSMMEGNANSTPIRYRRREIASRRKVGNIEDFITSWGADFDYVLVLDADSIMTGQAMARLISLMDSNPCAGIIQAMCLPVGRNTSYARLQQFGATLGGHFLALGAAFWQGHRSGYWGHNAILRTKAFAGSCGLPDLGGRGLFGGEILCHDTIEAALMIRAGWQVFLDTGCGGSWEEAPTNMADSLIRERRWCQGNLQHTPILFAPGLHPVSRIAIGVGILHYINAPIFLTGLVVASIFSNMQQTSGNAGIALATIVSMLLFGPKLVAVLRVLTNANLLKPYGTRAKLISAVLCEQAMGVILSPVAMVFQFQFVILVLLGCQVKWSPQERGERGLGWKQAAQAMLPVTAPSAIIVGILFWTTGSLGILALLPGLVLSVPLAVLTSRPTGKKSWIFSTPQDINPGPVRLSVVHIQAELVESSQQTSSQTSRELHLPALNPLAMPYQKV